MIIYSIKRLKKKCNNSNNNYFWIQNTNNSIRNIQVIIIEDYQVKSIRLEMIKNEYNFIHQSLDNVLEQAKS